MEHGGPIPAAGLPDLLGGKLAERRRAARRVLAPLGGEPFLLGTLVAYFAADRGSVAAAHALHLHRNTLAYRLGRVAAATGLDPRRFEAAVVLRVALELRGDAPMNRR